MHEDQMPRLNKIEGQIRGIKKMIEQDRYCMDILVQIKSAISALAKVRDNILKNHLNSCVKHAFSGKHPETAKAKVDELINFLDKMCR
jgi:DNA-binding FrmR family transcriptional regulator